MGDLATLRILDANLNRLKEGLRVVEDTMRYLYDSSLAIDIKNIRHQARLDNLNIQNRDSIQDILKTTIKSEEQRENVKDIVISNFKRAQESARVLEEYLKLPALQIHGQSDTFKSIRYQLYEIEKQVLLTHNL